MAGRAAGRDAGVVERGTGEAHRRLVARLARLRRGDMRRRLAFGGGAVVAGRAAGRDAGVVPSHRGECECTLVTAFAWRAGDDVGRRLAAAVLAVVAGHAGADGLRVIVAHLRPGGRDVTGLADSRGCRVPGGLAGRGRIVVAAGATARRTLEAAVDVTGGAVDAEVGAEQREACGEVVERAAVGLLRECVTGDERGTRSDTEPDEQIAMDRHSQRHSPPIPPLNSRFAACISALQFASH